MGFFSFVVSQHMYQRIFSARDSKTAKEGIVLGQFLGGLWYALPFMLGIIARAIFGPNIPPDQAFLYLVTKVYGNILGVLFLAALLSAVISTASTCINIISSNLTMDIYNRLINPGATAKQLLNVGRITTVMAAVIGVLIAIAFPEVLEVIYVGNKFMAVAAPGLLAVIFWPRCRKAEPAIFFSMLLGAVATTLWYKYGAPTAFGPVYVWALDPVVVGVSVATLVLVLGVWMFTNKNPSLNPNSGKGV